MMGDFSLRKANEKDIDILYNWVNDPSVRKNSFNSNRIEYTTHKRWFKKILDDKDEIIYIFQRENKPIGQIRFTKKDEVAYVDYSICRKERGQGLSRVMMSMAIERIKRDFNGISFLCGKVKPDNNASIRCFKGSGFIHSYENYVLNIDNNSGGGRDNNIRFLADYRRMVA